MITHTAEYALRAMVWLAAHADTPVTTQAIADATGVPADYLAKIFRALSRAGLVKARRGLGGGFRLSRAPSELTALEVVSAVEPIPRIVECPAGVHGAELCLLHRRLDDAAARLEADFRSATLAELAGEPGTRPLCERVDPDS